MDDIMEDENDSETFGIEDLDDSFDDFYDDFEERDTPLGELYESMDEPPF